MCPDNDSMTRLSPDDKEHPSKRLRTGDIMVTDSVNTQDYSYGVLSPFSSPFFPNLRKTLGPYLVDKTRLIEKIISEASLEGRVDLVLRPRRCGKSTMLQMIKSFFGSTETVDASRLFHGLYIANQHELCVKYMGKYPVIFLDFKNLVGRTWGELFWSFKEIVSELYKKWYKYLQPCLDQTEQAAFELIQNMKAEPAQWAHSLKKLSTYLARQFRRPVIVLIDEYEAPLNLSYEHGFFRESNEFFGRLVLPALLKTNESLGYALLAGVTPVAKSGWYSGLNHLEIHALHRSDSLFAGMLMFTEDEVLRLRTLSNCNLDPGELKAQYNSYLAGGHTSVYNPVSIMSAFKQSEIETFWVNTGQYPLLERNLLDDSNIIVTMERLLCKEEVSFQLKNTVTFSRLTLNKDEALTLLYYAGYLTRTPNGNFKIPNGEVMIDWARWVIGNVRDDDIIKRCVEGPVTAFSTEWPNFLENSLDPKIVAKSRGAFSSKTPERIYQVFLYGLLHALRPKGWEVDIEHRAGSGFVDIRLVSKRTQTATLIELKSSETEGQIKGDADKALNQIIQKNYRNPRGLPGIRILREYGIARYHLKSFVKARYLELNGQDTWVEKDDPALW